MPPSPITTEQDAQRLARAIISDLTLYNEQKIVAGIQNDNLLETMAEELKEGRDLYNSRVVSDLRGKTNFYERAIVDIMVRGKGHVKSKMW